jgi:hypothetical protein
MKIIKQIEQKYGLSIQHILDQKGESILVVTREENLPNQHKVINSIENKCAQAGFTQILLPFKTEYLFKQPPRIFYREI